jgi:two-component system response regulator PilR (NtrC family)
MSSTPARVLVVDDERSMREFLEIFLRSEGYGVRTADGVASARHELEADEFDVVITDVQMPGGGSGIDLLRLVQEESPQTVVIVMTAFASTEAAIEAMKAGAYDYVTKPFKVDEMRVVVEKALEKKLLESENRRLRKELGQGRDRSIVGTSAAMRRVLDFVAQVADTRANVLISGESGTGKEVVARAIHRGGERKDAPFVALNCGAIPENLLESELFGHVKGAFTGAVQNKAGLFEVAQAGTVFLDEIAELGLLLQVKLLRVIQERVFRRVGGTADVRFDARIVAATNRQLADEVREGRFREDLYYRLNVIEIPLPPLRERRDDIPLLAQHFVEKYSRELGKTVEEVDAGALARLQAYAFPGNVRELENVIERAVALCRGPRIDVELLPPAVVERRSAPRPGPGPGPGRAMPERAGNLDELVSAYERDLLLEALEQAGGVKKRAAARLGISFRSFRYRLEKLGLDGGADEE